MRKAAVYTLLALILSNALVVANKANSTGYENTIQHSAVSVEAIHTESDTQVKLGLTDAEAPHQETEASVQIDMTQAPSATSEQAEVSEEEVELLARIVSAEAKGEPFQGQIAVAAVILNRMEQGFGDSIREVIYAKGQFQPVRNGEINKEPVDSAYEAAEEALRGSDPSEGALYFANASIAEHHPNPKATKTVTIGDHTFYA